MILKRLIAVTHARIQWLYFIVPGSASLWIWASIEESTTWSCISIGSHSIIWVIVVVRPIGCATFCRIERYNRILPALTWFYIRTYFMPIYFEIFILPRYENKSCVLYLHLTFGFALPLSKKKSVSAAWSGAPETTITLWPLYSKVS